MKDKKMSMVERIISHPLYYCTGPVKVNAVREEKINK
jgi:hypothetical protein